jgi:hypothetical protein
MTRPGRSLGWIAAAVVLAAVAVSGCSSSSATSSPGSTPPASSAAADTSTPSPALPAMPPAPADFTATIANSDAPCETGDETNCWEWEFTWSSSADSQTSFRIYRGYVSMMGDEPCSSAADTAEMLVESEAGARSVKYVEPAFVGTTLCHWVTAFNDAGESGKVAAAGDDAVAAPAPFNFAAELIGADVACPGGEDAPCWQWNFTWDSTADSATWFRIYRAQVPLDGVCADVAADAAPVLETDEGARSEMLIESIPLGTNDPCYWITAVTDGGESDMVETGG